MEETTTTQATTIDESTGETTSTTSYNYGGKTWDSVDAIGKSYEELQSSFSKKLGAFEGSPEEYTRAETISENDPLYGYAATWGKENQLSDAKLNEFVDGFNKQMTDTQTAAEEAYRKDQFSQLGENAQERITNVVDFMKANTPATDETIESINNVMLGAEGIEVLEAMMKASKNTSPSERPAQPMVTSEKVREMRFAMDEYGNRKMNNPEYRANVLKLESEMRG